MASLADAERVALLELLRPWLRVLRERTFLAGLYDLDELSPSDVIWLRLPAAWEVDLRVFEAFELLALAGIADYPLWRQALPNVATGRALRSSGERHGSSACRIGCVLSFAGNDGFPDAVLAWSGRVVAGADANTASSEYVRARNWLEGVVDGITHDSSSDTHLIPVKIWFHEGTFEERMQKLSQVARLQLESSPNLVRHEANEWRRLFRIVEIDPGIPDDMTADAFTSMTAISRGGILIEKFKANGMNVTPSTADVFARGLQTLLGITRDHRGSGVKLVELPRYIPPQTVTALFSALRTSSSVRSLVLNAPLSPWQPDPDDSPRMTQNERNHFWRWVAFSVFGRRAAHSLHDVHINAGDLSLDDMHAFRDQICHEDHVPVFHFEGQRTVLEVSGCATVRRSQTLIGTEAIDFAEDVSSCRVLKLTKGDDNSISVLVPGYGVASIEEIDLVECTEGSDGANRPVEYVSVDNVRDQSELAVLELLRTLGGSLKTISISGIYCTHPLDHWFLNLMSVCSRLKILSVHEPIRIHTFDTITEAFKNSACRLEHLDLTRFILDDTLSLVSFFDFVATASSNFGKHIRYLQLGLSGLNSTQQARTIVKSVNSLLLSNHTLCKLRIDIAVSIQERSDHGLWAALKRSNAHNQEPIAVRAAPLRIENKLAFLSVAFSGGLAHQDLILVPRLIHAMDRPLLALIFEFAAECKHRTVSVRLNLDN